MCTIYTICTNISLRVIIVIIINAQFLIGTVDQLLYGLTIIILMNFNIDWVNKLTPYYGSVNETPMYHR